MLLRDENFSPKYLSTFTDLAEAKKELAKCVCKANFRGGISNETECTEFWLEGYEGEHNVILLNMDNEKIKALKIKVD